MQDFTLKGRGTLKKYFCECIRKLLRSHTSHPASENCTFVQVLTRPYCKLTLKCAVGGLIFRLALSRVALSRDKSPYYWPVIIYTALAVVVCASLHRSRVVAWCRIHECTIPLRFLGIIVRVRRLDVSVYNVYITNKFQTTFAGREVGGGGGVKIR